MKTRIFGFIFVMASLLFCSCTKKNSDSILLLGTESNVLSLNDVYPIGYQADMKDILEQTADPVIPDGFCPPNLVGNFHIDGALINGNERYINVISGDTISLQHFKLNDSTYVNYYKEEGNRKINNFDLKVINQNNASVKIEWIIYNRIGNVVSDTIIENAYLRGKKIDENRGDFALYFYTTENSGSTYLASYLITGVIYRKNGSNYDHETDGIENVKVWRLLKSRLFYDPYRPTYLVGGAKVYNDEDGFSKSIN